MTYGYAPGPVYVAIPAPKPPYRGGALVSWALVNIWNVLSTIALLMSLIGSIVGFGWFMNRLRGEGTEAADPEVARAVTTIAGSAGMVGIMTTGAIFLVCLIVTICTLYKLWPALLLQTIWYGICNLIATVILVQPRVSDQLGSRAWMAIAVMWGLWVLWLLFTILTAPGNARRKTA